VSKNTALYYLYCDNNYMSSPDSVIGWREIGLVINSPTDIYSGTFFFYPQLTTDYISFMYGSKPATDILPGETLSVEALFSTAVDLPQTMIAALYSESGKLMGTASSEGTIGDGVIEFNVNLDIPIAIDSGAYVKVFVWDSLTYTPMRDALTFPTVG
jgi:hypothetical protein